MRSLVWPSRGLTDLRYALSASCLGRASSIGSVGAVITRLSVAAAKPLVVARRTAAAALMLTTLRYVYLVCYIGMLLTSLFPGKKLISVGDKYNQQKERVAHAN